MGDKTILYLCSISGDSSCQTLKRKAKEYTSHEIAKIKGEMLAGAKVGVNPSVVLLYKLFRNTAHLFYPTLRQHNLVLGRFAAV